MVRAQEGHSTRIDKQYVPRRTLFTAETSEYIYHEGKFSDLDSLLATGFFLAGGLGGDKSTCRSVLNILISQCGTEVMIFLVLLLTLTTILSMIAILVSTNKLWS